MVLFGFGEVEVRVGGVLNAISAWAGWCSSSPCALTVLPVTGFLSVDIPAASRSPSWYVAVVVVSLLPLFSNKSCVDSGSPVQSPYNSPSFDSRNGDSSRLALNVLWKKEQRGRSGSGEVVA